MSQAKPKPGFGRKLGASVFWLGLTYMAVVGFGSVIPQVFGSPPNNMTHSTNADCQTQLKSLKHHLLRPPRAGDPLPGGDKEATKATATPQSIEAAAHWEQRYESVRAPCSKAGASRAHHLLGQLQVAVETRKQHTARHEAPLRRELEQELSKMDATNMAQD